MAQEPVVSTQVLRVFDPATHKFEILADPLRAQWIRNGHDPVTLREYGSGKTLPETRRGRTISDFLAEFDERHPDGLLCALLSIGDAGTNDNRAVITLDRRSGRPQLIATPATVRSLAEPLPWLVGWQTGSVEVVDLQIQSLVDIRRGTSRLLSIGSPSRPNVELTQYIKWGVCGLPLVGKGHATTESLHTLDDDVRHAFVTPVGQRGLYIFEAAILETRQRGWQPDQPLAVDLALYGDVSDTIDRILAAGYRQVFGEPEQPGDFRMIGPDRLAVRLLPSGYGFHAIGLTRSGHLGSYIARSTPVPDLGYYGPSIADQATLLARSFQSAWMVDEGLDPLFDDCTRPADQVLVRGHPNGRLSAVLAVYTDGDNSPRHR